MYQSINKDPLGDAIRILNAALYYLSNNKHYDKEDSLKRLADCFRQVSLAHIQRETWKYFSDFKQVNELLTCLTDVNLLPYLLKAYETLCIESEIPALPSNKTKIPWQLVNLSLIFNLQTCSLPRLFSTPAEDFDTYYGYQKTGATHNLHCNPQELKLIFLLCLLKGIPIKLANLAETHFELLTSLLSPATELSIQLVPQSIDILELSYLKSLILTPRHLTLCIKDWAKWPEAHKLQLLQHLSARETLTLYSRDPSLILAIDKACPGLKITLIYQDYPSHDQPLRTNLPKPVLKLSSHTLVPLKNKPTQYSLRPNNSVSLFKSRTLERRDSKNLSLRSASSDECATCTH